MPNKIKILFVIDSLKAGGAQRVMSFVASNIDKDKFQTTLAVTGYSRDDAFDLGTIEVVYFNKDKIRYAALSLFKLISKNDYHIVISTLGHINAMMAVFALFFRSTSFIGRETTVVGRKHIKKKTNIVWTFLNYLQRSRLKIMICQSNDMFEDLHENFAFKKEKLVIINNPISKRFELKNLNHTSTTPTFITVGRLSPEKGHQRILQCLSQLKTDFNYFMIGSGKEKDNINVLIEQLNLTKNVKPIPFTKEISKYLSSSDLYLQGSFVEGFPNALLESCAVGTPAIVFDAPGGINEIMVHGTNGFIAQSEEEFVEYINKGLEKKWSAQEVRDSVMKKYSSNKIICDYEELFFDVLKKL